MISASFMNIDLRKIGLAASIKHNGELPGESSHRAGLLRLIANWNEAIQKKKIPKGVHQGDEV